MYCVSFLSSIIVLSTKENIRIHSNRFQIDKYNQKDITLFHFFSFIALFLHLCSRFLPHSLSHYLTISPFICVVFFPLVHQHEPYIQ